MREERAPMQVFITNRPYLLYETVELLRAFVNALPGIALHLLLIPPIVLALQKAGKI